MAKITKTKRNNGPQGITMIMQSDKKGDGFLIDIQGLNVVEITRAIQMLSEALGDILDEGPDAVSRPKKKAVKKKK